MRHEIKSIAIMSLIASAVPALLFFLGLFGGFVTFVLVPNPQVEGLNIATRLLAVGLFSVLYMVLMVAILVVASFLYNFFTKTVGLKGIHVELEAKEE